MPSHWHSKRQQQDRAGRNGRLGTSGCTAAVIGIPRLARPSLPFPVQAERVAAPQKAPGSRGAVPSGQTGRWVQREDTRHSCLLLVPAPGAGTRALHPLPPPPPLAGLAPSTGDLGFKEQAAATAPAYPPGEEAGELRQSPRTTAGEMVDLGRRAGPLRGATELGDWDNRAAWEAVRSLPPHSGYRVPAGSAVVLRGK